MVVNFASLLPLTMGGIGTIEAVAPVFLISSGVLPYLALAMVLLQHAGQYLFTTISGGILYLAGRFYRIPLARPKSAVPGRPVTVVSSSVVEETGWNSGQLAASVGLKPARRGEYQLSIVIPAYNEQARLPGRCLRPSAGAARKLISSSSLWTTVAGTIPGYRTAVRAK